MLCRETNAFVANASSDVSFYAVAEDPGGGGHVQGGGGRHPSAGVRAQSGWDGGRDPGAGERGRGAVQRGAQHDLSSGPWNLQRRPPVPVEAPRVPSMEFLRHENKNKTIKKKKKVIYHRADGR